MSIGITFPIVFHEMGSGILGGNDKTRPIGVGVSLKNLDKQENLI
ncbi:hypothetical protein T4A_8936 [Trichinella pseudospiralis]|uniref:Uncharacterized protein n=1 Tax=Trichinella pseudospiralis TaxID=6337 RepID=A0A0V1CP19_TRIPS|nr:hypothetical protein T4A_8936 [Trichinella pseudospiralis]